MHFLVGHVRAVHAVGIEVPARQIKHVAVPEQRFRAALIEDGARVDLRRHLERDASGNVGLDRDR
jgi:hypothetical protein